MIQQWVHFQLIRNKGNFTCGGSKRGAKSLKHKTRGILEAIL